jgi:hypothetical protein
MKTIEFTIDTIPTVDAILQHAWNGNYELNFFVQLPELHLDVFQAATKYGIADLAAQGCENCINLIDRMDVRSDVTSLVARVLNISTPQSVQGILEALAEHCANYTKQYHNNANFINVSIAKGSLFGNMVLQAMERIGKRQMELQEKRERVEEWTEGLP